MEVQSRTKVNRWWGGGDEVERGWIPKLFKIGRNKFYCSVPKWMTIVNNILLYTSKELQERILHISNTKK
jgi:hypothetical protein